MILLSRSTPNQSSHPIEDPMRSLFRTPSTTAIMIKRLVLSALCLMSLSATAEEVNTSAKQQLSDAYVRSALTFFNLTEMLETDEPGELANSMMASATRLNPDNAQAWSMWAELAQSVSNQEAYEKALVGYLNTGVDDDRARFKLIQYRLSSKNTLDAQLREVERLLNGETGRGFSGPLRSRLASFASTIADELGDERAHRKWAVEAARADPGSVEAAQRMLDLVVELGGDAVKRGTATINVIRASPLDASARLGLATQLAEQGAYARAAQQFEVVSTRLSQQPLQLPSYVEWANCLALSGQDELLLTLLDQFEAALNQPAEAPAEDAGAEGAEAVENEQEKVDLPLALELARLAVLRDAEDQDQAQIVFDRIARQLSAKADEADADAQGLEQRKLDLVAIAALFCPDLDKAQAMIEEHGSDRIALGWITLRKGDKAQARAKLQPHAATDALAACGLAFATAQDDAGLARLLQNFIDSDQATPLTTLAAGRAMLGIDTPAQPTTTGKALLALMAKSPESFWLVDLERTPWLDVRMRIKPQRIKPLQPIRAEITLWNTSRFPLGISESGPINQSAVITINATSSGRMLPPTPPVVVDLGQRYSLKAGERLIIDTRLDYHQFGALRANNPGVPVYFDTRLLINPALNHAGLWRPSGIGGLSDVRDNLIEARPTTKEAIDSWLDEIDSEVVSTRLNALQRLSALNRDSQPGIVQPAVVERVTAALLQAWDNSTELEQAWIIQNAVALDSDDPTFPALLEKATESRSKDVWTSLLTTHATEAESKLLTTAIGRQDLPEVSRFAEKLRRLLNDFAKYQAEQTSEQQPVGP